MKYVKHPRIIILAIVLLLAFVAINPRPWHDGAAIRNVEAESAAALAGISAPEAGVRPVARERIIAVNNEPVRNEDDYFSIVNGILNRGPNQSVLIQTNEDLYNVVTQPLYETTVLNETETVTVERFDNETNTSYNDTVTRNKTVRRVVGVADLGLTVYDAPTTNIRKGLDLSGGTRVVLQPQEPVSAENLSLIVENIKQRLNVFGLSDLTVRTAEDLSGESFIIVEIAGANKDKVRELLSQQGRFEAKIANETVFRGGDRDITYVCRSASCSGIDPFAGCGQSGGLTVCRFTFTISLSPAAAERQATVTDRLDVIYDAQGNYLSQPLELFLDGEFVDSLNIASELKGRRQTDIQISGSGEGATVSEARQAALQNMLQLQTIMITGSLPVELDIVKTDSISPALGKEFVSNALLVGVLAMIGVILVVVVRYREIKVAIPMVVTMFSEAIIILGFASIVGWNLDLAAIAAIIIAIGTGVDDQIVIADETLRSGKQETLSWKQKIKRAFFIIMAAYVTTVAAMVPLWFAGAGMLRGFAITTIIGVSVGVFVTRPAFGVIMKMLFKAE